MTADPRLAAWPTVDGWLERTCGEILDRITHEESMLPSLNLGDAPEAVWEEAAVDRAHRLRLLYSLRHVAAEALLTEALAVRRARDTGEA